MSIVTTWDAAQGTRYSAYVLAKATAWANFVNATANAEAASETSSLNAMISQQASLVAADGARGVAEAAANEAWVGSVAAAQNSHAFAVESAWHTLIITGEANAWQIFKNTEHAAQKAWVSTVSAAAETATNAYGAAYVTWVSSEADAARTYAHAVADAVKVQADADATAEKAAKMRVGNAYQTWADAKGAALRTHREAVANAEDAHHQTVWPQYDSFIQASTDARKAVVDAVAVATKNYRVTIANATKDYVVANAPGMVTAATAIANAHRTYEIAIANINKDASMAGADDLIAKLTAKPANEFFDEPQEPTSMAQMMMDYVTMMFGSFANWLASKYDEWVLEAGRKMGRVFGFLSSVDQFHNIHMAEQSRAFTQLSMNNPNVTVQDVLNTCKLPPEAIEAIAFIASTYFEFLGSGASFVSPSMAAFNAMPSAMQAEARAALGEMDIFCTGENCFVAGTEVIVVAAEEATIVTADGYIAAGLAVAAIAGHEVSRRRNKRKRRGDELDDRVFANWEQDASDDEDDELQWSVRTTYRHDTFSADEDWRLVPWQPNHDEREWEPMQTKSTDIAVLVQPKLTASHRARNLAPRAARHATNQVEKAPVQSRRSTAIACKGVKVEKTNRYGRIWLVALLTLAGWFGVHSMSSESSDALVPITVNSGSANRSIATKNIEEIQVGDRVYAENPTDDRDDSFASNINRFTWRKLTLEAEKIDGGITEVTLLRPREWIHDRDAQVGGQIHLHLAEVGVDGPARVLAIEPCPEIQSGVGQVVTGTFKHLAANVINLQIDSLDEPIGVTANHPIWSHDRQTFVLAGNLKAGERLRTLNGLAHVTSITERGPPETVHNFEVHLHHVYHVTQAGLLVHNSYDAGQPPLKRIHSDSTYEADPDARQSLAYQRTRSTEDLIESLRSGQDEPLTTKVDGRIFQGNTRIKVLQERGVDVDRLPRVILPADPLDNPFVN